MKSGLDEAINRAGFQKFKEQHAPSFRTIYRAKVKNKTEDLYAYIEKVEDDNGKMPQTAVLLSSASLDFENLDEEYLWEEFLPPHFGIRKKDREFIKIVESTSGGEKTLWNSNMPVFLELQNGLEEVQYAVASGEVSGESIHKGVVIIRKEVSPATRKIVKMHTGEDFPEGSNSAVLQYTSPSKGLMRYVGYVEQGGFSLRLYGEDQRKAKLDLERDELRGVWFINKGIYENNSMSFKLE